MTLARRERNRMDRRKDSGLSPQEMDLIRQQAMDLAGIGLLRERLDGTILYCDRGALRILDLQDRFEDPSEVAGLNIAELISYLEPPERLRATIREHQRVRNLECPFRTLKGELRWALFDAYLLKNGETGEEAIQILCRDITQVREVEERLQRSEQLYRTLAEGAEDFIFVIDREDRVRYVNSYAAASLHCTPQEIIGRKREVLFPPDIARQQGQHLQQVFQTGQKLSAVDRLVIPGKSMWLDTTLTPVDRKDGVVETVMGISRDITSLKQAEEKLLHSELRYRTLFETSKDAILLATLEGRVLDCNDSACHMYGYLREDLLKLEVSDLAPPDVAAMIPQIISENIGKGELHVELVGKRRDGAVFPIEVNARAVRIREETLGIVYVRDITERERDARERQQLENDLRHTQKMEALGQLAGGVAHDFNNLLTAIIGSVDVALDRLSRTPAVTAAATVRSCLEEIEEAGQRAASLTRQLLTFSRKQVLKVQVADPNQIVADLERLLRRLIGEHIVLKITLTPSIGRVRTDVGQMEQVLMNLALNARDAMPQGGTLTIQTGHLDLTRAYQRRHVGARTGPHVVFTITDTGTGMDQHTLDHIFEPFFTTKAAGRGTGLGLATVYGIITQAGGHITVESTPGGPTTFRIHVPAVSEPEDTATELADRSEARGKETVLICEDEGLVLRLASRVLKDAGYTVLEAQAGDQAIQAAASHPGPIHLLVTDVVMPGLNGRQLADALRTTHPTLRVLFVSGYTSDLISTQGVLDKGFEFLPKPFDSGQLLQRVREVLDSTGR